MFISFALLLLPLNAFIFQPRSFSTLQTKRINLAGKNEIPVNQAEFSKWEEEELYLKQQSLLEYEIEDDPDLAIVPAKKSKETLNKLPEYMTKLLNNFEEVDLPNNVSIPASKLPVIAVVGRPNTGNVKTYLLFNAIS